MPDRIRWNATEKAHPAREAARGSMAAASGGDRDGWLRLFTEDAVVEDPIGPSPFDPEGKGHRGKAAIAAFWDASIGYADHLEFDVSESLAAGNEVANIATITTVFPDGNSIAVDTVITYRVDDEGRITALRAYWELERLTG